MNPTRTPAAVGLAIAAVLGLGALTACGSDSDAGHRSGPSDRSESSSESLLQDRGDASGGAEGPSGLDDAQGAPTPAPDQENAEPPAAGAGSDAARGSAPDTTVADPQSAAIIATGTIDLVADDVAEARRDVQLLADQVGGRLFSEETTTDPDGVIDGSRLELRAPSASFDDAMTALEDIAPTATSTRSLDDVSTEIVDTEARVRAQRASLQRVEALLVEAEDLSEIVAIEAELTRRQADLDSLASQLAYLTDATSFSTITVYVERDDDDTTDDDRADADADEAGGFLDGLREGWDALVTALAGVAMVTGVVLPWLGLALLIGIPAFLVVRRLARRPRSPRPPRATPGGLPGQPTA